MDRLFIKAWLFFVAFLVLVAIVGIRLTAPRDEEPSMPLAPISGFPKENPMILVPAGEFFMGSNEDAYDEKPLHPVFLDAYRIHQYEVTQYQYAEFVKITKHRSPLSRYVKNIAHFSHPDQPAVYVSWEDADAYCRWRGERLPTEAQWEKAARGLRNTSWPWAEAYRPGLANFLGNEDQSVFPVIVGSYEKDKSRYGLYDVAGNIREWVSDWYEEGGYQHTPYQNPTGPSQGDMKVLRGGSWNDSPLSGRTTSRMKMFPDYRDTTIGFRCANPVDSQGIRGDPTSKGP